MAMSKDISQVDALVFRMDNLSFSDDSLANYNQLSASPNSEEQSPAPCESGNKGFCFILSFQEFDESLSSEKEFDKSLSSEEELSDRDGNEIDIERLSKCFESLGCDVKVRWNLKSEEIPGAFESAIKKYSKCKYFVCCILTHGDEDILFAYDKPMQVDNFLCPCTSELLDGKPKIFFIQACRGDRVRHGNKVIFSGNTESFDGSNFRKFGKYPDFFIMNSTFPGDVSFRNPGTGSYFIQNLCDCLESHGSSKDLLLIATDVSIKTAVSFESQSEKYKNAKMMPHVTSTLTTKVFFGKEQSNDNSRSPALSSSPSENEELDSGTEDSTDVGRRFSRLKNRKSPEKKENGNPIPRVPVDVFSEQYPMTNPENVKLLTFFKKCKDATQVNYQKILETVCRTFQTLGVGLHSQNPYKKMKDITECLQKFSGVDNHNIDCLICFLVIPKLKDYLKLNLLEIFTGDKLTGYPPNKSLIGKPKIFIILTCDESEHQNNSPQESTDGLAINTIPVHADWLEVEICGQNLKDMEDYIKRFCVNLEQNHSLHILEILTKINCEFQKISNNRKISRLIWNSTLTRCVYLPKI